MHVNSALLCDAVTVREGLLHILGGGITRLTRQTFPAPLGISLALRIMVHPTEATKEHQLQILLIAEDGASIATIDGEFKMQDPGTVPPGEEASFPLAVNLGTIPGAALPKEGAYSLEILIDGIHQTSVPFRAVQGNPGG